MNEAIKTIDEALKDGKEWVGVFINNYDMMVLKGRYPNLSFIAYKDLDTGARMTLATWARESEYKRIRTEFWGLEGDFEVAMKLF